jgi:hypothetical protein
MVDGEKRRGADDRAPAAPLAIERAGLHDMRDGHAVRRRKRVSRTFGQGSGPHSRTIISRGKIATARCGAICSGAEALAIP